MNESNLHKIRELADDNLNDYKLARTRLNEAIERIE